MLIKSMKLFAHTINSRIRSSLCRRTRRPRLTDSQGLEQLEQLEQRTLLSAISGTVFDDANGDGTRQSGEVGLENVRVFLDTNGNGVLDAGESAQTTDELGNYVLNVPTAGTYAIGQQLNAGSMQTSPGPATGPDLFGTVKSAFPFEPAVLAGGPLGMEYVDGLLYQINWSYDETVPNTIHVIDPFSGQTMESFDAPGNVRDIAYSNGFFWGIRYRGEIVKFEVVDDGSGGLTASIVEQYAALPGESFHGIATNGVDLWVLESASSEILKVDTATGAVISSFSIADLDSEMFGLTFDGMSLWANGRTSGMTYQFAPGTGEVVRSFPTPVENHPSATGIAWDGEDIWLTQWKDFDVLEVDVRVPGTHLVSVDGTNDVMGFDFGQFQLGSVSGQVFEDLNGDGQVVGDPPLVGRAVYLDTNQNARFDPWEHSTQTNADGSFTLDGIPAGDSQIGVDLRMIGWEVTTGPATQTATLTASGGNVLLNPFGVKLQSTGPVGTEFRINQSTAGTQQTAWAGSVADFDANGNHAVVWKQVGGTGLNQLMVSLYDNDGALRDEFPVSPSGERYQSQGRIAMAPDGQFAVTWVTGIPGKNDATAVVRLFHADGTPRSDEIEIANPRKQVSSARDIAMDAAGNFAVLFARYDAPNGGKFGGSDTSPTYFVQRFNAQGAILGEPILLGESSSEEDPAGLAMDADGNFVAVWYESFQTHINRYNSSGQLQGNTATFDARKPLVAMNSSGSYVVAFEPQNPENGRLAQLYSADGVPIGNQFRLAIARGNSTGGIAMDDEGLILFAYERGDFSSPTGSDIYLNAFAVDEFGAVTRVAREQVLNATRSGEQILPTVAMNGRGDALVVWNGAGVGDDDGVFAQRFQAPAAPPSPGINVTPTSGLETAESGDTATFDVVLDTQPAADVLIDLSSSDTTEGTIDKSSLTFNSTNWFTPQTVTITGVDDSEVDGDLLYSILTAAAVSSDPAYSGLDAADVSVTNLDDDQPVSTLTVTGVAPSSAAPGEQLTVTVTGTGFVDGATVDFGQRVNIQGVTFVDTTQLQVDIKVHPKAGTGPRDVTVTNPDGTTAILAGGFTVGTSAAATLTSFDSSSDGSQSADTAEQAQTGGITGILVSPTPAVVAAGESDYEQVALQESVLAAETALPPVSDAREELDELFLNLDANLLDALLTV